MAMHPGRLSVLAGMTSNLRALLLVLLMSATAWGAPVLLTESSSTRAIALSSPALQREPFQTVTPSSVGLSQDTRTRVMLFVMNLDLLAGEGASAFTADAEDAQHRHYPLVVEAVSPVPGNVWMSAIVLMLNSDMANAGDVLVRISLHGVSSNRVRIAVGRMGGGPPDDPGASPQPAPNFPGPSPTPVPTPNTYTGPASSGDAARFLEQSAFGPTPALLVHVQTVGFKAFLNEQFSAPLSGYPSLPPMPEDPPAGCIDNCFRDNYTMYPLQVRFFQNSLNRPDQLRQRVAFALSEIFVTSGLKITQPSAMSPYQQMLTQDAFGNYRQLLYDVTLSPAMGHYLDMVDNNKPNPDTGDVPNENYAREIQQLFSIGLNKLNQDGTLQLDARGQPIRTYDQDTIEGFSSVFTGWTYAPLPNAPMLMHNPPNYQAPMAPFEMNHDTRSKKLLNGVVLPAGQPATKDLNDAIDNIFNHPNVGPFIGKQLIGHLVTSNPSPAYVGRVAAVFNNNGQGVRGDLKAVLTAILFDPEARGDVKTDANYGHLREPAIYTTGLLRAFNTTLDGTGLLTYSSRMRQNIFNSPTVFNYFPPNYRVRGTTSFGPEFGIQTTATAMTRLNYVNALVFSGIPSDAGGTTVLDLMALAALAGDPVRLVNNVDQVLLHGTMSSTLRSTVVQAVSSVPDTNAVLRAQTAVYLVASSSQYQLER